MPTTDLSYLHLLGSLWTLVRKHSVLRRVVAVQFLIFAAFISFWSNLALLMAEPQHELGGTAVGLLALVGVVGALSAPIAGRFSDRRGPAVVVSMGAGLVILAFLIFGLWQGSIIGLVTGIVIMDLAVQSSQVANQSRVYALETPDARLVLPGRARQCAHPHHRPGVLRPDRRARPLALWPRAQARWPTTGWLAFRLPSSSPEVRGTVALQAVCLRASRHHPAAAAAGPSAGRSSIVSCCGMRGVRASSTWRRMRIGTIADFRNGADRIDLGDGLRFRDVNETSIPGGVRLTFDGAPGLSLTVMGITAAQLGAEDFL